MHLQMPYTLTHLAIKSILKNPSFIRSYLLQAYDIKNLRTTNDKSHYSLWLSDDVHCIRNVLSTSIILSDFDVMQISKYRLAELKGHSIIVEAFAVIFTGLKYKIGKPNEVVNEEDEEFVPVIS